MYWGNSITFKLLSLKIQYKVHPIFVTKERNEMPWKPWAKHKRNQHRIVSGLDIVQERRKQKSPPFQKFIALAALPPPPPQK
jgi:hypothetical protein